MKEQLITFETAKLAKEKGFGKWSGDIKTTWYCHAKYFHKKPSGYNIQNFSEKEPLYISGYDNWVTEYPICDIFTYAPTKSLLQRWLREKHNIIAEVSYNQIYNYFELKVFVLNQKHVSKDKSYSSYEEALKLI